MEHLVHIYVELYPHCYIFILLALVGLRVVLPLNSAAVAIIWSPVNLPVEVVDHYTVHYTSTTSSGVVGGLMTGHQYQFSISVTLAAASGQMYIGPVSTPSEPVTVSEPQSTQAPYPPPASSSSVSGLLVGLLVLGSWATCVPLITEHTLSNMFTKNPSCNELLDS